MFVAACPERWSARAAIAIVPEGGTTLHATTDPLRTGRHAACRRLRRRQQEIHDARSRYDSGVVISHIRCDENSIIHVRRSAVDSKHAGR